MEKWYEESLEYLNEAFIALSKAYGVFDSTEFENEMGTIKAYIDSSRYRTKVAIDHIKSFDYMVNNYEDEEQA